jgi:hypothetical protein
MFKKSLFRLLAVIFALFALNLAHAETANRIFPKGIKVGILNGSQVPDIVIDDKARNITPSTRIYGQDNLLVKTGSLPAEKLIVAYRDNEYGDVDRIWILTAEEIVEIKPLLKPKAPVYVR